MQRLLRSLECSLWCSSAQGSTAQGEATVKLGSALKLALQPQLALSSPMTPKPCLPCRRPAPHQPNNPQTLPVMQPQRWALALGPTTPKACLSFNHGCIHRPKPMNPKPCLLCSHSPKPHDPQTLPTTQQPHDADHTPAGPPKWL